MSNRQKVKQQVAMSGFWHNFPKFGTFGWGSKLFGRPGPNLTRKICSKMYDDLFQILWCFSFVFHFFVMVLPIYCLSSVRICPLAPINMVLQVLVNNHNQSKQTKKIIFLYYIYIHFTQWHWFWVMQFMVSVVAFMSYARISLVNVLPEFMYKEW